MGYPRLAQKGNRVNAAPPISLSSALILTTSPFAVHWDPARHFERSTDSKSHRLSTRKRKKTGPEIIHERPNPRRAEQGIAEQVRPLTRAVRLLHAHHD